MYTNDEQELREEGQKWLLETITLRKKDKAIIRTLWNLCCDNWTSEDTATAKGISKSKSTKDKDPKIPSKNQKPNYSMIIVWLSRVFKDNPFFDPLYKGKKNVFKNKASRPVAGRGWEPVRPTDGTSSSHTGCFNKQLFFQLLISLGKTYGEAEQLICEAYCTVVPFNLKNIDELLYWHAFKYNKDLLQTLDNKIAVKKAMDKSNTKNSISEESFARYLDTDFSQISIGTIKILKTIQKEWKCEEQDDLVRLIIENARFFNTWRITAWAFLKDEFLLCQIDEQTVASEIEGISVDPVAAYNETVNGNLSVREFLTLCMGAKNLKQSLAKETQVDEERSALSDYPIEPISRALLITCCVKLGYSTVSDINGILTEKLFSYTLDTNDLFEACVYEALTRAEKLQKDSAWDFLLENIEWIYERGEQKHPHLTRS